MSALFIDHINAAQNSITEQLSASKKPERQSDFASWLSNELSIANNQISDADTKLREFAIGKMDNLHEVMISLEKAKTSFELIVEVRNRILEGYQEIMRMQI